MPPSALRRSCGRANRCRHMRPGGIMRQRFEAGCALGTQVLIRTHAALDHKWLAAINTTRRRPAKIRQAASTGGAAAIPMTCAYVRAPAPASGRAPSGEFILTRKPRCITAKFENSHPSFIGTLLGYEK